MSNLKEFNVLLLRRIEFLQCNLRISFFFSSCKKANFESMNSAVGSMINETYEYIIYNEIKYLISELLKIVVTFRCKKN